MKNSGNFQFNEHKNFVFLSKNAWDIRLKVGYPYHKILQLSSTINCQIVELVSYHLLMVPKGTSECFLGWNLILNNLCFLGFIGKMFRLWVWNQLLKKKIFLRMQLGINNLGSQTDRNVTENYAFHFITTPICCWLMVAFDWTTAGANKIQWNFGISKIRVGSLSVCVVRDANAFWDTL